MATVKIHVVVDGQRTTATVDQRLAELMCVKHGEPIGSTGFVQTWAQGMIDQLGVSGVSVSSMIKEWLLIELIDNDLWDAWLKAGGQYGETGN